MKKTQEYLISKNSIRGQTPDLADKKNIQMLIRTYKKKYPYPHEESLKLALEEGRKITTKEVDALEITEKTGRISLVYHLPYPFVDELKKAYPLIFIDKTQYEWFLETFPNLALVKVPKKKVTP
jgi:hypothetical protein